MFQFIDHTRFLSPYIVCLPALYFYIASSSVKGFHVFIFASFESDSVLKCD